MHSLRWVVTSQVRIQNASRLLHTTSIASLDSKWRRSYGLPITPRQEPEFLDRPDYSFLDGRPTPIGRKLKWRYEDEKRLAADAVKYIGHVDYAIEKHNRLKVEAEENARKILNRKLKPKGPVYKPKHDKEQE